MKELVYISQAKVPFSSEDIKNLLDQARAFNLTHGITGILLFDNNKHFIQLIEGDDDKVDMLFARIEQDPRHTDLVIVHEDSCTQRTCKKWSMEYLYLDSIFNEYESSSHIIDNDQKELIMDQFVSIITQHFGDILDKL